MYTKKLVPFDIIAQAAGRGRVGRLGLIAGFDNTELRHLYDNFKPKFVLFIPLFSNESIWHHKNNDNNLSFFDQLSKLGNVIINDPKLNQYIMNSKQCVFIRYVV